MRLRPAKQLMIAILSLLLLGPVIFFSIGRWWGKASSPTSSASATKVSMLLAIEKLWEQGDFQQRWQKGELQCPFFPLHRSTVGENYTKCNALFLQCVLASRAYPELQDYGAVAQRNGQHFLLWSAFGPPQMTNFPASMTAPLTAMGINFAYYWEIYPLDHPHEVTAIFLADTCGDSFLPEGTYYHGPDYPHAKQAKTTLSTPAEQWDNYGQQIFVDKYLVSNQDIWLWQNATGRPTALDLPTQLDQLYRPALGLSAAQMHEYCYFRGKTLLQSHILDAASFYRLPNTTAGAQRGPYPWTAKRKDSFLYLARKERDYPHSPHFCEKVFTQECLQRKFNTPEFYATDRASWMGIFDVLGGPPEFVDNRFVPSANVRASSYYFPMQSQWHQIGKRASWNLQDFSLNSFQWNNTDEETRQSYYEAPANSREFTLAFRCMVVR